MDVSVYIEGIKVDLFEDESIILKSSIADVSSISELKTDFTRTFTVPASKNNNKLFKHFYRANIDNSFDARKLVSGEIKLEKRPFKYGKYSLHKVTVKDGVPYSYTVNFTGNLLDISSLIGDDMLSDMDFSEYDHNISGSNVINAFSSKDIPFFNGDLSYAFFYPKQCYYNSDNLDGTNNETLVNIASNNPPDQSNGIEYNLLRPSIKTSVIVDKIQSTYGLSFSDDFFSNEYFTDSFIYLGNSEATEPKEVLVEFDSGWADVNYTDNTFVVPIGVSQLLIDTDIANIYDNVEYTIIVLKNGEEEFSKTRYNGYQRVITVSEGDVIETYITSVKPFVLDLEIFIYTNNGVVLSAKSTDFTINNFFDTNANFPGVKTIDFLTSIFKAFKLIVVPQDDGTLFVDTLNNYYDSGVVYDVDKYFNVLDYEVSTVNLISEVDYKFTEPSTILNDQFNTINGIPYGDEYVLLTDENGDKLEGDTEEIELAFEMVLCERIDDINMDEETTIGYGALIDESLSPAYPSLLLHYIENEPCEPMNIILETGNFSVSTYNRPTFVKTSSSTSEYLAFMFSSEYDYFTRELLTSNLYTNYHQKYIEGIFNKKRRDFVFKSKVPAYFLSRLNLNDTLKLGNNYYKIDYFEANLLTGETTFKLFNYY